MKLYELHIRQEVESCDQCPRMRVADNYMACCREAGGKFIKYIREDSYVADDDGFEDLRSIEIPCWCPLPYVNEVKQ